MHYFTYAILLAAGSTIIDAQVYAGFENGPDISSLRNRAIRGSGIVAASPSRRTPLKIKAANGAPQSTVEDAYSASEDGKVTSRDFTLLVKAMRQNPDVMNEALDEFEGVPGMRDVVEQLIQAYTETDGQLTMNNFAALVDAMSQDPDAELAVVAAFNSNMLYAFLVKKLLTKFHQDQQQALVRRYFSERHFGLGARNVDDMEDFLARRDIIDEDLWLGTRDMDDHSSALRVRQNKQDDNQALKEIGDTLRNWVFKNRGKGKSHFAHNGDVIIDWSSRSGVGLLKVKLATQAGLAKA